MICKFLDGSCVLKTSTRPQKVTSVLGVQHSDRAPSVNYRMKKVQAKTWVLTTPLLIYHLLLYHSKIRFYL